MSESTPLTGPIVKSTVPASGRRLSWREAHRQRRQECIAAWNALPELPGTHWQLRRVEGQWQIITDGGSAVAVVNEGMRWPHLFPEYRQLHTVQVVGGPTYRRRQTVVDGIRMRESYIDAYLGVPVLHSEGRHFDHSAGMQARLSGQCSGQQVAGAIRFPVEGTKLTNAVMRAIDESGATLLQFRRVPAQEQKHFRLTSDAWFDIVATPGLKVTPELLLVAAVAAPMIIGYFQSGG